MILSTYKVDVDAHLAFFSTFFSAGVGQLRACYGTLDPYN